MTFLWPDMLGLLLAAPLLVGAYIYVLRRRRKAAVNVPHLATIKLAMSGRTRWRRHVPPALLLVSFCLLVLAMMAVWTAEAMNTAVELVCDYACPERHAVIGMAKDVAAGAVLLSAVGAVGIGITVFYPRFFR